MIMTAIGHRCFAAVTLVLASGIAGPTFAATWTLDHEASSLTFEGVQTEKPFDGEFETFNADIELDPSAPEGGSIRVTVETGSFATGASDRDEEALTPDWFDIETFPEAVFQSQEISHVEGNSFLANGTLTIKGVERQIELPFTLDIEGNRAVADGTLTLDRLNYDLGVSDWADGVFVALEVVVKFHVEADRNV